MQPAQYLNVQIKILWNIVINIVLSLFYSGTRYNEVPRDRTIYFVITGIRYKRYPDTTTLLKKYEKLILNRPKLYNTNSGRYHFPDDDSASESCNLHVIETKNK